MSWHSAGLAMPLGIVVLAGEGSPALYDVDTGRVEWLAEARP